MNVSSELPPRTTWGQRLATQWTRLRQGTLRRLARRHCYPLQEHLGHFSGAGWELLCAEVASSQVVLLGESHGTAQIPVLAAAIAGEVLPVLYVTELDSYVAQQVTKLATDPAGPGPYLRRYPAGLCIASWAEEFTLARDLVNCGVRLVGIDQVFAASAGPAHAYLAEMVTTAPARAELLTRAAAYLAHDQAVEHRGDELTALAMLTHTAADLTALHRLAASGPLVAQQLAADYALSHALYQSQDHQARVDLLRRNLLRVLVPAPGTELIVPRTLVKLGAFHVARGLSPLSGGDYYDVGSLLLNLVEAQGQQSLHVFVVGRQGTKAIGFNPNFSDQQRTTYSAQTLEMRWLAPLLDAAGWSPNWSVIDLRPLRAALTDATLRVPDLAMQRLLLGYDLLVVVPETTASRPL